MGLSNERQYTSEQWLTDAYDYQPPRRGQMRKGVILKIESRGITVDIGLKRDGFVPQTDVERLEEQEVSGLEPGKEIVTRIVKPKDQDDHILSLSQARREKDWRKAEKLLEDEEVLQAEVVGHNKGGLLVKFSQLQGFIPTSHLMNRKAWRLSGDERAEVLETYVGEKLSLQFIEVNQENRRLILSERAARQQTREQNMERLLSELVEGEVRQGTVARIKDFGAFIDLGGANGLVHVSELAWQKIKHPSQVLQEGDEVDVYVLNLDHERKRIGLSIKRLQPNPWLLAQRNYSAGQLVSGRVTNLVDFGVFVALDVGVEGLVHISELADPEPEKPQDVVQRGDELVFKILKIDPFRQRIGLSLNGVSPQERDEWLAQEGLNQSSQVEAVS